MDLQVADSEDSKKAALLSIELKTSSKNSSEEETHSRTSCSMRRRMTSLVSVAWGVWVALVIWVD